MQWSIGKLSLRVDALAAAPLVCVPRAMELLLLAAYEFGLIAY